MSDTLKLKPCPKCGGPIPAEAPQGLCPKCLLAQASVPTEAGQSAGPVPTQQELAAAFPQLEILSLIGQGGMGFVFKARQPKLERFVALKILPQSLAADPAFADRFTREGRLLARLNHPNIVTIHDFGQANGFFYLLMEFVDGVNLREAMRAGRFTPEQALAVVPRICDALQFAHNEGILHRDIKPENILLDSKGRIKIADFGIAKLVGDPRADAGLTATGGTLGTPHYMAPEQVEKPATVDHRADIYSLGVVFYEMLTGELPLGKFQPPSQKVQVDVRLDDVVLHALEKEPARRYQQVSEVKTAVDTIASAPRSPQRDPLPGQRERVSENLASTQKPDRFWRRFAVAVALFLAGLILIPMGVILLGILIPAFMKERHARTAASQAQRAAREAAAIVESHEHIPKPKLLLQSENFRPINPEPGRLDWGFKVFVPPDSLASVLFVRWSNGVPTVDPGFSAYFKVGSAGGIDVPFCSLSCYPIPASQAAAMTKTQDGELLSKWGFPGAGGTTNVVQWNVNLGLGFTSSSWRSTPAYHQINPSLPQSVEYGHQLSFPLVEFDRPAGSPSNGWSGMDLRIFLEPLQLPPIRTLPNEKDMTNYVGGIGIAATMEEVLKAITGKPVSTAAHQTTAEPKTGASRLASIRKTVVFAGATTHAQGLSLGTDSTLLPGESLLAWMKSSDRRIEEANTSLTIQCASNNVRTTCLLNYIFPDSFGSEAADAALAQLDQNITHRPIALMPGERTELFSVTNKAAEVLVGYAEFKRSVVKPPNASAGSNTKTQATVSNLHFRYTFPLSNAFSIQVPEFDYSASVPPGCALRATVNQGAAWTSVSRFQNRTLWDTRWLPASQPLSVESSLAIRDLPKQVRLKQAELDEQIRRLKEAGPLQIALGEPKWLFSVTNSAGEPFLGFFELVGPDAEMSP